MIWLGKIYFHNLVEKRGGTFSRPFSRNKNSLKSDILKKIIFFVSEYGNLIGVKNHCDRLGSLGKTLLNRRFKFFGFERD